MKITPQLIQKPQWSEPIRLLSGRLTGQERHNFILHISNYNILLSAKCIANSTIKEKELTEKIVNKAYGYAIDFKQIKNENLGFLALLELNRIDLIIQVLKLLDLQYNQNVKLRTFEIIPLLFQRIEFEQLLILLNSVFEIEFENFNLIKIAIPFLKQKNIELSEQSSDYLMTIASKLFVNKMFDFYLALIDNFDLHISINHIFHALLNQSFNKINFNESISIIDKYYLLIKSNI